MIREFWRWHAEPGTDVENAPRYDNWLDVFRAIRRLIGNQRLTLILDEFPWAVETDPSLPSRLQAAWDQLFKDQSHVCLVLSGSHIRALEKLLHSDAPLFGRMTGKLYVPPFAFTEITPFVPRYSAEKRLAVYAVVGASLITSASGMMGRLDNQRAGVVIVEDLGPASRSPIR